MGGSASGETESASAGAEVAADKVAFAPGDVEVATDDAPATARRRVESPWFLPAEGIPTAPERIMRPPGPRRQKRPHSQEIHDF